MERELARENSFCMRQTDLSRGDVQLDRRNKMLVTFAKAVFSPRTLVEGISHYTRLLYCEEEVKNIRNQKPIQREGSVC